MSAITLSRGALRAALPMLSAFILLAGCSGSFAPADAPLASPAASVQINGNVHGGVYPIQNATVRLWETQSNGYGGAAKQLLPSTTSDSGGNFNFSSSFTCDTGQYAYITVTSGHTAANATNNNVIQVDALGDCNRMLTLAQQNNVNVYISELSTIAAAYTLGSFISIDNTDAASGNQLVNISAPLANSTYNPGCTGVGSTLTCTANGLGHAFANASNLVDAVTFDGSIPSGDARSMVPGNTYSIVPQAEIGTFGNILQSCVDSPGGVAADGSNCGLLFNYATPPGGTAPTNTLEVALNMARYPTNNVGLLFGLQPRFTFFAPYMSLAPNDLSLAILYGANAAGQHNVTAPVDLALDQADQVYMLGSNGGAYIQSWYPNGAAAYTAAASGATPIQIAIDPRNLAYVNDSAGTVQQASTTNGTLSTAVSLTGAQGIAVDRAANLWTANTGLILFNSVTMYNSSALLSLSLGGLTISTPTYSRSGQGTLNGIAIDAAQNVWAVSSASSGASTAVIYGNKGTASAPNYATVATAALKTYSNGAAVAAGASGVYFPLTNSLNAATFSGSSITTSTTIAAAGSPLPGHSQADGNNAIYWASNDSTGKFFVYRSSSLNPSGTATVSGIAPCVVVSGACVTSASAYAPRYLKGLAIDSSGDVWLTSAGGYGEVFEVLGAAAPTWPLLSYGKPGVMPQ